MTEPNEHRCPQCDAILPAGMLGGLCMDCVSRVSLTGEPRTPSRVGVYELLEEIASGGMGVVWRARHTTLNRTVAVKMIRGGLLASARAVERFHAEAEAVAQLRHPNIVAIHEIGEVNGAHFFAMDFIDGANLEDHCAGRPREAKRAASLIATIARAVAYAHERGILHRDLKPQNVLIGLDGEPRLTDFGLATRIDAEAALTQTGTILGSPNYMAPEQMRGRGSVVTTASDVYGLGAIFYEVLTGWPPFTAENPVEVLRRIAEEEPRRPSVMVFGVDSDLETICLKCLEKNPANRYPSAVALAEDLERWLRNEPIHARSIGPIARMLKWVRRKPSAAAASLVTLIAVVAVSGLGWRWNIARRAEAGAIARRVVAERSAESLRAAKYAAELRVCEHDIQYGDDLGRARVLLDAQLPKPGQPDLRGWEWRHYWFRCRPQKFPELYDFGAAICGIALSPDEQFAALLLENGKLELWDIKKTAPISTLSTRVPPTQIAFSRRKNILVAPCEGAKMCLLEIPSGVIQKEVNLEAKLMSVDFSPDGTQLASYEENGRVSLWNVADGKVISSWSGKPVQPGSKGAVCFIRGSPLQLAFSGGRDELVNILTLPKGNYEPPWNQTTHPPIAASPDGKWVAVGLTEPHRTGIQIANFRGGWEFAEISETLGVAAHLIFSKDSDFLLAAFQDAVCVYVHDQLGGGQWQSFEHGAIRGR